MYNSTSLPPRGRLVTTEYPYLLYFRVSNTVCSKLLFHTFNLVCSQLNENSYYYLVRGNPDGFGGYLRIYCVISRILLASKTAVQLNITCIEQIVLVTTTMQFTYRIGFRQQTRFFLCRRSYLKSRKTRWTEQLFYKLKAPLKNLLSEYYSPKLLS